MVDFSHNIPEMLKSGRIDPSRQAMLVVGPHGQYTVGALCFYSHWVAKGWPWTKMSCVVADVLLNFPVIADYLLLVNTKPASVKVIDGLLESGRSVALYPGGIHEQVRTDENEEKLYFPAKLTFVRLAIKHGVDLVPLYSFGENSLWPTSNFATRVNKWLYKMTGIGNVLLHSPVFKIPTSAFLPSPLLFPRFRHPLKCRFGDQVQVGPPDDNPSTEKVLQVFDKYVASLLKLFDEHKEACLPAHVAARGLTVTLRAGKESKEKVWKSKYCQSESGTGRCRETGIKRPLG